MPKQLPSKPLMRIVKLTETDWKWLTGWLEALTKSLNMDDINQDSLRMGGIVQDIKAAKRDAPVSSLERFTVTATDNMTEKFLSITAPALVDFKKKGLSGYPVFDLLDRLAETIVDDTLGELNEGNNEPKL